MRRSFLLSSAVLAGGWLLAASPAQAFCGFYVAKADTDLFNQSSQVAVVRDGDRTVITMANDYQGDPTEFAMVIPVPTAITKDQVHVSDGAALKHLDAYTAPRLVEYFDSDPCGYDQIVVTGSQRMRAVAESASVDAMAEEAKAFGVTIEDSFTEGEYDILILSAEESDGLQTWLEREGYRVPADARRTLGSYIRQDMKFFVAKVNLEEQARTGLEMLRPIAVAYESPKFMLPIRLGTVNAKGSQDLFAYMLTKDGQVETTNYRTVKIPTDKELPIYVKDEFDDFYRSMYATAAERKGGHGVFMEYAWDMNWCDPCAADPLSAEELRELGVWWVDAPRGNARRGEFAPQAQPVFVTRLHVRYDADSFPEDLKFKQTGDRSNFQGRYILRHAFDGDMDCDAADDYLARLDKRQEKEIRTLANLTGWKTADIRDAVVESGVDLDPKRPNARPWWEKLWDD